MLGGLDGGAEAGDSGADDEDVGDDLAEITDVEIEEVAALGGEVGHYLIINDEWDSCQLSAFSIFSPDS